MAKTSPLEFIRQVQTETRKVVWPTRRETVMTAVMVMIMTTLLAIFFLGVDAFFVISGWLITWKLLDEKNRHGSIGLRRFWTARARRLMPASVCVLIAVGVAWPLAGIDVDPRGENAPTIEIMLGDAAQANSRHLTHTVAKTRTVKIILSASGEADGLEIEDAEDRTTILRFEN